jgi:hypothetical protein
LVADTPTMADGDVAGHARIVVVATTAGSLNTA